jgi:hypothetical protein
MLMLGGELGCELGKLLTLGSTLGSEVGALLTLGAGGGRAWCTTDTGGRAWLRARNTAGTRLSTR